MWLPLIPTRSAVSMGIRQQDLRHREQGLRHRHRAGISWESLRRLAAPTTMAETLKTPKPRKTQTSTLIFISIRKRMAREVCQPARRHARMGAREWNTTTVTGGASFGRYQSP